MIRIAHLITDLDVGGAETMLVRLVGAMNRAEFDNHVISLLPVGPLGGPLEDLGIPVQLLAMRRGRPRAAAMARLAVMLRRIRPNILQTWLYHTDVLGTLAAPLAGVRTLAWNVRALNVDMTPCRALSSATRRMAGWLSRRPAAVIVNSAAGRAAHEAIGYRPRRWCLIPNGIECEVFRPDGEARASVRRSLGIDAAAPLVGLIARFHSMKGHHTFVQAAASVCRRRPDVRVLLAGAGVDRENGALREWLDAEGIAGRVSLLGARDDIAKLNAALDVAVMASTDGEGFPTAVAEAMACEVPCVVTDVGDAGSLVGDTGYAVPPRDAGALADACERLVAAGPEERRARVCTGPYASYATHDRERAPDGRATLTAMSGIAGRFKFVSGAPVDAAIFTGVCDLVAHRGPDGAGVSATGTQVETGAG
ncbi:MAG TPA: glycosyltransferase [Vicinamibacterales bacterium]|nr:glycosyltransferase [Vicinamibacterales bacterium]